MATFFYDPGDGSYRTALSYAWTEVEARVAKLSRDVRTHLRLFAFFLANSTVDWELLGEGYDYDSLFENPSDLERVFAIWSNVVELDSEGNVLNPEVAKRRAAQYIRRFVDPEYVVEPPFADWELELH